MIRRNLRKMILTDKNKIKNALELIRAFEPIGVYINDDPHQVEILIEDLKKILNTLTDEKGIEYVWTTEEIEETQLETRQERALEKGEKVLELIDKLLWNISDSKERWINTSVNHEAFNSFLDAVISNLEKMKKTLEP